MNIQKIKKQNNIGFTLVEVLVAVGIFSAVVILVTNSLLNLSAMQKSTQSSQEILNELRFSLDLMGREINSGSAFPDGCEKGCDVMVFASRARPDVPLRRIEYYLNKTNGTIMKGDQKTFGICSVYNPPPGGPWDIGGFDSGCYQPFTSEKVKIDFLKFFVNHKGENEQTIVSIAIKGTILPGTKSEKPFEVSSSFSPRLIQDPSAVPPTDNIPPMIEITSPTTSSVYATNFQSIAIGGITTDNIEKNILQVKWTNSNTGAYGYAFSLNPGDYYANWQTFPIKLRFGDNNITAEATDKGGNTGTDTINIRRNRNVTWNKPSIGYKNALCSSSGTPYNRIDLSRSYSQKIDLDRIYGYVCEGTLATCTLDSQFSSFGNNPIAVFYVGTVKDYEIYIDSDGPGPKDWILITAGSFPQDQKSEKIIHFDATDAQYVRFKSLIDYYKTINPKSSSYTKIGELTITGEDGYLQSISNWLDSSFPNAIVGSSGFYNLGCTNAFPKIYDGNMYSEWTSYCSPSPDFPHRADLNLGAIKKINSIRYISEQDEMGNMDLNHYGTPGVTYTYMLRGYNSSANPQYTPYSDKVELTMRDDCSPSNGGGNGAATPSFTLSANPKYIKVGVSNTTTTKRDSTPTYISVTPKNGFNATVQLSASGGPSGISYHFLPDKLKSGESLFWVTVPDKTTIGTYTLTISGQGGGKSATTKVVLDVNKTGGGEE